LTSGTQARADWRGLFSAAVIGSGVGLGLGASYLAAGMAQVASDHIRAERIAQAARGGFSETMLQRETDRMDPAALRLARAHDAFAGEPARDAIGREAPQAWPSRPDERLPAGGRGSVLDSARELDCLTQAVYFEARGETPRGQAAVAQVVMNRVANPSFPKSVCGVVFQGAATHGCQFSFACDGSMRRGREVAAWDRARRIAERALSGVRLADIGKATHFHTTDCQPDWGPQMLRVAQVGLHVFYRSNPHAPTSRPDDGAVFVSLPMGPASNLRLATALLEKTADTTVAASGLAPQPAPSAAEPKAAAKPPEPPASLARTAAPAGLQQSGDAAAS
jgi:spore germination cell wall hydrolase CwlJ-like protein